MKMKAILILIVLALSSAGRADPQSGWHEYSGKLDVNLSYVGENGRFWTAIGILAGIGIGITAAAKSPKGQGGIIGIPSILGGVGAQGIVCNDQDCGRKVAKSKQGRVSSELRFNFLDDDTLAVVFATGKLKGCVPVHTYFVGFRSGNGIYDLYVRTGNGLPDRSTSPLAAVMVVEDSRVSLKLNEKLNAQTSNNYGQCFWTIEPDTKIELNSRNK